MPDAENLIKIAWLCKLPQRIQEIVLTNKSLPFDELSKLGNKIYMYGMENNTLP